MNLVKELCACLKEMGKRVKGYFKGDINEKNSTLRYSILNIKSCARSRGLHGTTRCLKIFRDTENHRPRQHADHALLCL